ncbi:DUF6268 family outer membrane beta-barrel protein [Flectobacillus rivi]|uniref:DUF6268 family outer membrane beta-barrel protein n=1 Tax=Flectobacillus rivi TaxID=2984209 RepID=A0ABT6YYB9_9BACT|nr:DUF6268 family outer membrane beta-barrel protein [Flectobacillus rivi]MDI9873873.1 DUF6268 family outer membrane beta-barrel protein [Flectobacillus rivi]
MFKRFSFTISLMALGLYAQAQNNSISQIFYPNITIKTEAIPSANMGDGKDFGLTRTSTLGFVPLSTDFNVGIGFGKKFDIQAKHTFLVANLSQINPTISGKETPSGGYKTLSAGVFQLKASLRDKFWLYGGGLGITESNETFFSPQPFLWGGAARVRVLGLNTQIMYGTAVVFNQKFRIIPIFGFNKRINEDWRISGILPFQVTGTRKITEWFNLGGNIALGGYSGGFQELGTGEKLARKENYQQVKFTVSANAHVLKVFSFSLEGGIVTFRQDKIFNSAVENLQTYHPGTAPYIGASVRYISNKNSMGAKLMSKLGI